MVPAPHLGWQGDWIEWVDRGEGSSGQDNGGGGVGCWRGVGWVDGGGAQAAPAEKTSPEGGDGVKSDRVGVGGDVCVFNSGQDVVASGGRCGACSVNPALWCDACSVNPALWCDTCSSVNPALWCGARSVNPALWCDACSVNPALWCDACSVNPALWCDACSVNPAL